MICPKGCEGLFGALEMVNIYIKNKPSRMNLRLTPKHTKVGELCPVCKHIEFIEKIKNALR